MAELILIPEAAVQNTSARDVDRLEAEIAFRRHRFVASFTELRERVDSAISWRQWLRSHLGLSIATALSLGFMVGYRGNNCRHH